MLSQFLDDSILYDGAPLQSLWAFRQAGLQGDSIVSFAGPCKVEVHQLVDLADAKAGAFIFSPLMLHFIVEHFDMDLDKTVCRQRLLTCQALEEFQARLPGCGITRQGNDLYEAGAKISVSIATASPVSTKIHFGINIRCEGTPVKTRGLADYGLEPKAFSLALLKRYASEFEDMRLDRCKVRGVA